MRCELAARTRPNKRAKPRRAGGSAAVSRGSAPMSNSDGLDCRVHEGRHTMTTTTASASVPFSFASLAPGRAAVVAGRVLTGIPALFLAWDAAMKIVLHPLVV